jgi:hypothetical protein
MLKRCGNAFVLLHIKLTESAANKAIQALSPFYNLDWQIELCSILNPKNKCVPLGITQCPLKEKRNNSNCCALDVYTVVVYRFFSI